MRPRVFFTSFALSFGANGWNRLRLILTLLTWCVLAGSGCQVVTETATLPVSTVKRVVPREKSLQFDPATLQTDVQHYADDFASRSAAALDECARQANTPEDRRKALNWKLALDSAAINIATGPNPMANLLDFLAVATFLRTSLEQRVSPAGAPCPVGPWLEASRILEINAWKLAERVLTAEQQKQCRAAIGRWCAENVKAGGALLAPPEEFALTIRQSRERESESGSLFSLVGLDPTSGLDPAVREITRTRLFAERALFAAERMPLLMRWHVEFLAEQLLCQEQVTAGLQSVERLSRAAESASQTAAELPGQLSAERQAIVEALEGQESKLRALAAETSRTLAAGEQMSASLNTTLLTFDALMKRFGVGEPDLTPPNTNTPPFNILDYARTAQQVAAMAQELDELIQNASGTVETPALDQRLASLRALSEHARADAQSVLNHAFLLAAGLVLFAFACALASRRLTRRSVAPEAAPRQPPTNRSSP